MKFTIITHAEHKIKGNTIHAYEPYVREMNLWLKNVDEVIIVAPVSKDELTLIDSKYQFDERQPQLDWGSHDSEYNKQIASSISSRNDEMKRHSEHSEAISPDEQITSSFTPRNDGIKLIRTSSFDITSLTNGMKALVKLPKIFIQIYKAMQWADHIHLRCPGNIGLLGCLVQIVFPSKQKTIKYAGNWDPKSKQPVSYRIQKWIVSNTFLTRNTKVLVYGEWPKQSKNIVPFFTATYSEKEIDDNEQITSQVGNDEGEKQIATSHDSLNDGKIYFLFVGALTKGKKPLLSVKVVHELKKKGYKVQLDIYGDGDERENIANYILDNSLENELCLHGNTSLDIVKKAYQKAHFLIFLSKSEGWPKVVAEAMFWRCLPITSNVSCIPYMLDKGNRGAIVTPNEEEIVSVVEDYLQDTEEYQRQVEMAMEWSRKITLEKFEEEIGKVILNSPLD